MVLVQLSERLHSVEIAIGNMLNILQELAIRTPGVMEADGTLEAIPGIKTPPLTWPPYVNVLPNLRDTTLKVISGILTKSQTTSYDSIIEMIMHKIVPPSSNWGLYDSTLPKVKQYQS